MSYRIQRRLHGLGDDFPWKAQSQETLQLQIETNEKLKTAGFCPIPVTGFLEGSTCGARNFLTLKSQELFGKQIGFSIPEDCTGREAEWQNPVGGCYKPGKLPFSKKEWILIGGAVSAVLAAYLMVSQAGPKKV
jgi:hypothetical protein